MAAGQRMTDTTAGHTQDSGMEWSDLLHELAPVQREAVVAAIQHSASTGCPASRESIGILVAYALGRISSREYAVQIMVALGFADTQTAATLVAPPAPPQAERSTTKFNAEAGYDFLLGN